MLIFPAIDIYEKKAVRLYKGDYSQMTIYSDRPEELVKDFIRQGAKQVHLVDLEGARKGAAANIDIIRSIINHNQIFTEVGGGIRDMDTIDEYIDAGADRVILGTAAVNNIELLKEAVRKYGEKIAVGVDVRDGYVAIKGWTESSDYRFLEFGKELQSLGIRTIIATDISKDGAMKGISQELYLELSKELGLNIIASGGVSKIEDILKLRAMGLHGAVIGRAYYTGDISLREAIEVAG